MALTIGNTKVYSSKEVQQATLYSRTTVENLFKDGIIKHQRTGRGEYQIEHGDLKDFLIEDQDMPEHLVDEIIEFRLDNSKVANTQS